MATPLHQRAAPHGSGPHQRETERALKALVHCTTTEGHVAVLEVPDAAQGATLLRELARRIDSLRLPLLVCAEPGGGERIAECILAAAGAPITGNLQRGLWELAARSAAEGRPIALLVDGADSLSPAALATLLELAQHSVSRSSVVLAVRSHAYLLDGFRAHGASIDLIRITGAEDGEPSAARQSQGAPLRTIEELLGDESPPRTALPSTEPHRDEATESEPLPASAEEMEPATPPTRSEIRVTSESQGPMLPRVLLLTLAIAALFVVAVGVFEVAVTARMASRWLASETPRAGERREQAMSDSELAERSPSLPPVGAEGPVDDRRSSARQRDRD